MMTPALNYGKPGLVEAVACPLCGSPKQSWDFNVETFGAGHFEKDLFSIYRCRDCGIGITDPLPTEEDSRLLYEERVSCDFQVDDSSWSSALKNYVADRDVRAFTQGIGIKDAAPRMLDYACGNGAFALSMRRVFPQSSVWATDYHSEAPEMLKGSGVPYVSYAGLSQSVPFNIVLCRHVLEHTYDPVMFLCRIGDLIRPNGILIIEVPNFLAPMRKIFGKHWDGYYVPYHPIHFSATALRQAVTSAGFVPQRAGGCEMPKIGRSLRNTIGCQYNSALFIAGVLLHPVQFLAAALTGEPTCLRIWARKEVRG
jgi:SAM-dependent methyltransferase